jgi:hypothetical protein
MQGFLLVAYWNSVPTANPFPHGFALVESNNRGFFSLLTGTAYQQQTPFPILLVALLLLRSKPIGKRSSWGENLVAAGTEQTKRFSPKQRNRGLLVPAPLERKAKSSKATEREERRGNAKQNRERATEQRNKERKRVRESESQRVRESESQRVRESESQRGREEERKRGREEERKRGREYPALQ